MTTRNRQGSHISYWRLRHVIDQTLPPIPLPRLVLSAAFLFPSIIQRA
jgi:hypothetical protein